MRLADAIANQRLASPVLQPFESTRSASFGRSTLELDRRPFVAAKPAFIPELPDPRLWIGLWVHLATDRSSLDGGRSSHAQDVVESPPLQSFGSRRREEALTGRESGAATPSCSVAASRLECEAALAPLVRDRVWSVDPGQTIYHLATVESLLAATLAERRFHLGLLGGMAALALAIAAVGVYALISFSVRQLLPELGVRLALGARPSQVVELVVREGASLTITGVAIGLAVAWATTRLMRAMLYGVTPNDPVTFIQLGMFVVILGAVASAIPAIRAVSRDPVRALHEE